MKHLRKFNESLTPEQEKAYDDVRSRTFSYPRGEEESNNIYTQFGQTVRAAADPRNVGAHQKMIDLLDKYGVDLIKDRRYIALKWAAELGKEEVMDVLLDKLKDSGEDMDMIHKMLVPYASGSAWR